MTGSNAERLKDFYAHFDGSRRDFANDVLPKICNLYHHDMRLYTAKDECKNRDDLIELMRKFNNAGGRADMSLFEETSDGDVLYAGRLTTPDCGLDVRIHSRGTFKDGKLFLIQPTDPGVCLVMMNHDYKEVVDDLPDGACPGLAC